MLNFKHPYNCDCDWCSEAEFQRTQNEKKAIRQHFAAQNQNERALTPRQLWLARRARKGK